MLDGDAERVEEYEEYNEPEEQLMFHDLADEVPENIKFLVNQVSAITYRLSKLLQYYALLDRITSLFSRTAKIADTGPDFEVVCEVPTPDQLKYVQDKFPQDLDTIAYLETMILLSAYESIKLQCMYMYTIASVVVTMVMVCCLPANENVEPTTKNTTLQTVLIQDYTYSICSQHKRRK